ncbi:MAG: undecaprenyldiphospho-muramoylpentapeptide beta-N-acetylglucosaminyltransferase [Flavobacteriaceae bacterium]|nr:undecaprenyldiphospho-muramoylpentapeptide beta-N-acetylglucosaminyltransferase [Flavobacteriaceae bacterium]
MKQYKIIISGGGTGGHLFPAIAIAEELLIIYPKTDILFVGALNKIEMKKVPEAGYRIIGLWIDGFKRASFFKNIFLPIKLIYSLFKSLKILMSFRPDLVIGTGGYASGPILFTASILKFPTLIQEQNSYPGITNKILSKRVNKIAVAYENMDQFFPYHKITITGNPVRKFIFRNQNLQEQDKHSFNFDPKKKVLLVLGGSNGSKRINELIYSNLNYFKRKKIQLLWQCGSLYFEKYFHLQNSDVLIFSFTNEIYKLYSASDYIISRSGAITLSELTCVGKPLILIPSPNVAEDHQRLNSLALSNRKAAIVIEEKFLDEKFRNDFDKLLSNKELQKTLSNNLKKMAKPNASKKIIQLIKEII